MRRKTDDRAKRRLVLIYITFPVAASRTDWIAKFQLFQNRLFCILKNPWQPVSKASMSEFESLLAPEVSVSLRQQGRVRQTGWSLCGNQKVRQPERLNLGSSNSHTVTVTVYVSACNYWNPPATKTQQIFCCGLKLNELLQLDTKIQAEGMW